jgi:hypothetical protein
LSWAPVYTKMPGHDTDGTGGLPVHPHHRIAAGATLLLILTIWTGIAGAGSAECLADLDQGRFIWSIPGQESTPEIRIDDARTRFAVLDSLLADGDPAEELRAALGAEILGPVWGQLAAIPDWQIIGATADAVPGPLCGFATLTLPDASAEPALARYRISLGWPEPLQVPASRISGRSGELLLSSPFAPDTDPATDDPDTLRHALSSAVHTVRMIPRNETDAPTLQRALEESRPGLWWFRGENSQLAGLQPAFGALPSIVVWSLPARSGHAVPALFPATFASGGSAPGTIIVAVRAVRETILAAMARDFVDALATGQDCGEALHRAQQRALASGVSVSAASGLILVGDPTGRVSLKRASWLRRIRR